MGAGVLAETFRGIVLAPKINARRYFCILVYSISLRIVKIKRDRRSRFILLVDRFDLEAHKRLSMTVFLVVTRLCSVTYNENLCKTI